MPPEAAEVFETITELGEDRHHAPAPSQELLSELWDHIDINEHHKPSVFTQACNDLCRFGYDHPDVFGTSTVLDCLFRALKYKPDHDDEDEGVLTVPLAAIKALAVLTSSTVVRGRLNGLSHGLPAVLSMLQLPYATAEIRTESLSVLANACCSRPLAQLIGRQKLVANTVKTLISPPYTLSVQNSVPMFAKDFALEGAIDALAVTLAAPSTKANFITQNRAALLLAAMARYPALNSDIVEAAKNAPSLREAAAKAAAKAAAAEKAARMAMEEGEGSDEEDMDDPDGEEESEQGSEEEKEGSETEFEAT